MPAMVRSRMGAKRHYYHLDTLLIYYGFCRLVWNTTTFKMTLKSYSDVPDAYGRNF
jgi:hypothetical protein